MNKAFTYVVSVFAAIASGYLSFTMLSTLGATVWVLIGIGAAASVVYFYLRIRYLKRQGRDLIADMRSPYPEWSEREEACRKMDEELKKSV